MALEASTAPYEAMGPSLLAQQPPTLPQNRVKKEKDDWGVIYAHCESSLGSMRNWRWARWSYWNQLAAYLLPRRHQWVVTPNKMRVANLNNDNIVDSTGTLALNTCSSGMWAGLTNPGRPWLKLGISTPGIEADADAKDWLEDTEERLYTVMGQSNFYTQMAQAFEDLSAFATSPPIIYEDYEDVIRLYLPCAGEYFLKNGARFSADTIGREFNLTVEQIVDQFGLENCPQQIVNLWGEAGGALDREYVVCHLIEPNFDLSKRNDDGKVRVVPQTFIYRELYWLKGIKTNGPLSKRGFRTKPFMAFRWALVSNDPYGSGCPGMVALGDIKQLQMETREKAEVIKKISKPPMGANVELKNEPNSIWPGHINYMSTEGGQKGFWPLFQVDGHALPAIIQDNEQTSERIKEAFFVNVFMAITQMEGVQPRNELELTKRDLERLQKLGPVINLVEAELKVAIERILDIMMRRTVPGPNGRPEPMLKPRPASLRGVALKIEFVNIMRIAQRSAQAVGAKDYLATLGGLSSAAKAAGVPDPLRCVNLDKTARKFADVTDFWSDCVFTDQEVQEHDAARAKAMQAAQAPQQAMAAVTAAKTLSETGLPNGDSALSAMLGQGAGQ